MIKENVKKIIRKKIIWEKIKQKEMEFRRIQSQIDNLKKDSQKLANETLALLEESCEISEHLDQQEYEHFMNEK